MALTPTQLSELQDISIVLADDFPHNVDQMWDTAMRIQQADLGPLGPGGIPTFEATVADIKLTQEQIQTVQGRNAGESTGFSEATLEVIPVVGGSTILIEDDGAPLAGAADTLDFVGDGVVAAGAGGTKTVTIPGVGAGGALPVGTLANASLRWNGAAWEEEDRVQIFNGGIQLTDATLAQQTVMTVVANDFNMSYANITDMNIGGGGMSGDFNLFSSLVMSAFATIYMNERATALGDTAAQGQFWVRDDVPNTPMFTNDVGTDFDLTASTIVPPIVLLDNEQIQFGTGTDWRFSFDGSDMILNRDTGGVTSHLVLLSGSTTGPTIELRQTFSSPENSIWFTNTVSGEGFNIAFTPASGSLLMYAGNDAFAQQQLKMQLSGAAVGGVSIYTDASLLRVQTRTQGTQFTQGIYMIELAAAGADITASGQLWTRNDAPNNLMFTDDVGTDFVIGGALAPAGDVTATPTPVDNQVAIFDSALSIEGDVDLTFNGTQLNVGPPNGTGITTMRMSSAAGYEIRVGTTAGGWARGVQVNKNSDGLRLAGMGFLGAGETVTYAAIGLGLDWFGADSAFRFYNDGSMLIAEQAAAVADIATYGQFWVRNDTPNTPMFTTDTGLDFVLGSQLAVQSDGIVRAVAITPGELAVRSDTDTDTEVRRVSFTHQDGTIRGFVGYNGADRIILDNRIDGGLIEVQARDSGSVTRDILIGDPDAITELRGDTQVTIGLGPTPETGATFALGGAATLYFNDSPQLATNLLGANIENTLTLGGVAFGVLKLEEGAGSAVDTAGQGQLTVQNLAPNMLRYTGDTGVDQTVNFAGCRLQNADGAQSVATGSSYAPLSWGLTPAIETHSGFYDEATDDTRIVVPTAMAGTYIITGGVLVNSAGNADGTYWAIGVSVNGGRVAEAVDSVDMSTVAFPNVGYNLNVCSGPIVLAAADFIELETTTDDTGSLGISTAVRTFLTLHKIA